MVAVTVVDAFTGTHAGKALRGNPAAVVVLTAEESAVNDDVWRQDVAAEMNLSETAFLTRRRDATWDLRWFTPTTEVNLCGHATLACAHVLAPPGDSGPLPLRFHTRSGLLSAQRLPGDWIELDFPLVRTEVLDPLHDPEEILDALLPALGIDSSCRVKLGRAGDDALVEVAEAAAVRALTPNFAWLATLPWRGVIVTAPCEAAGADFVSRFFAPAAGINEDPVTGSAHCALGPWWGARLGKQTLVGVQVSERGGLVRMELRNERVLLAGQALTTLRGELLI